MSGVDGPVGHEALTGALLILAVESWRFGRAGERVLMKLDEGEQRRHQRQLRWFQRKLEETLTEVGMRIVSLEGHAFDPGMAATPLNLEEFDGDDALVVDRMFEPIVMGATGVIRAGTVTLKKADQ